MTRLKVLVNSPRRTLAALATVLVAVGITAASGASFTASSASPGNVFATGTLKMTSSKDNAAILTAGGLRPGDSTSGTVDIQNTGSLTGTFTLSRTTPLDTGSTSPLSGKLNVVIGDCGATPTCTSPTQVYSGTLAGLNSALPLGTFAAGEKHTYKFTVTLDSSADNGYQNGRSETEFDFNAV
jgi:spore coat-associated protein N